MEPEIPAGRGRPSFCRGCAPRSWEVFEIFGAGAWGTNHQRKNTNDRKGSRRCVINGDGDTWPNDINNGDDTMMGMKHMLQERWHRCDLINVP